MKARAGTGWQYLMTDLSMILFMITAAAVGEAAPEPPPRAARPPAPIAPPALGEPIAVWSGGTGAPPLPQWLAAQPRDPRQRLTIVAPLGASAEALQLAAAARRPARVLLEPGTSGAPFATLTYDQDTALARGLQPAPAQPVPNPPAAKDAAR